MSALLICVLVFSTVGCRTAPPMAPVDLAQPGWNVHHGQALWTPKAGAPELAGHLMLASNASGEDFIRFSKEPMDLVLAQCNPQGWSLHIPAFNKSYSGRGQPPRRIGWFQFADAVFRNRTTSGWEWSGMDEERWVLTNARTGERLEGFFRQ